MQTDTTGKETVKNGTVWMIEVMNGLLALRVDAIALVLKQKLLKQNVDDIGGSNVESSHQRVQLNILPVLDGDCIRTILIVFITI